jgi:hypothetical protein
MAVTPPPNGKRDRARNARCSKEKPGGAAPPARLSVRLSNL